MEDVVQRLEMIIESSEARIKRPKSGPRVLSFRAPAAKSPWSSSSRVMTAMETLASRIEDLELRKKLNQLCKLVENDLGPEVTNPHSGVYCMATLIRFLHCNEMDVNDAKDQIVLNFNARVEFKMDAKRNKIVGENLGFETLPGFAKFVKYQPTNNFVGRAKNGDVVTYTNFGSRCDARGLRNAFSVEEYIEGALLTVRTWSPSPSFSL